MLYTAVLNLTVNFLYREASASLKLYDPSSTEEKCLLEYKFSCKPDNKLDDLIDYFDPSMLDITALSNIPTRNDVIYELTTDLANAPNVLTLLSLLDNLNENVPTL